MKEGYTNVINRLKKAGKMLLCMLGVAVITAAAIPAVPAQAAQEIYPGFYSVTVVPTYQNPDTGVIDDVGQNPGIGNMMVQAQVQPTGYVEIEEDGTIWLNTRWNLADANIYAGFSTSSDGSQTWTQRDFTVTNQVAVGSYEFMGNVFDATVTDFRFQLDTLNDTIRCTNYVDAMARDCIWFCYITDIREGVGDDWNVVQAPNMTDYTDSLSQLESEPAETYSAESYDPGTVPGASAPQQQQQPQQPQVAATPSPTPETGNEAEKNTPEIADRTVAEAKTIENDAVIKSGEGLDDSTGIVGMEDEKDTKKASSPEETGFGTAQMVIGIIAGIAIGAVVVWAIYYVTNRRKKQHTDLFGDVDDSEDKEK